MAKKSKKLGHDPLASRPRGLAWMAPLEEQPKIVSPPVSNQAPLHVSEEDNPLGQEVGVLEKTQPIKRAVRKRQTVGGTQKKETDPAVLEALSRLPTREGVENSARKGLPTGYKRHTFILSETLIRQVKTIAFIQERPIKDVVEEALQRFVDEQQPGKGSGLEKT